MRKTENTIALLGGALLGAAAMYVLDPDMGKKRRRYIADQAGDYFDEAGNLVRGGWETVRDRASNIGSTMADKAADYRDRVSDLADEYRSRIADRMGDARDAASDGGDTLRRRGMRLWKRITGRASDYADDYADRADDLRENVTDYGNRLWNRVQKIGGRLSDRAGDAMSTARHRIAGEEESSPLLPITLTGLGCCALGVGLMYLMDPRLGRSRRAWLADKTASFVRRTGQTFYGTGRDLANRAYGVAAETREKFGSSGPLGSEQLLQRVRSQMGRAVSHPRLVQVMTDANGCVTLSGCVLSREADELIGLVESIPGVSLVVNRLESKETPEELDRAAGAMNQGVPQM
jgi:gas vesicle protein